MYLRLPFLSGSVASTPLYVAMARNAPILAMSMNVTNGVSIQAFRMSPTGLTEIPVVGQVAGRTTLAVSISPDGKYLLSGGPNSTSAGYNVYVYDGSSYVRQRSSAAYTTYHIEDFEWLDEETVVYAFRGNANRSIGALRLDDLSTGGERILNEVTGLQYGMSQVHRTENGRNLVVACNNLAGATTIRTFSFNSSTRRIALTTTSQANNGGSEIAMRKDGYRIVSASPTGAVNGTGTKLMTASGVDAGYTVSNTVAQNLNGDYCSVLQINDSLVMTTSLSNGTYRFYQYQSDLSLAEVPSPIQFQELVSSNNRPKRWAKNTNYNGGYIAGWDGQTADLYVYYPLNEYKTTIVTDVKPVITSASARVEEAFRIDTKINSFTTQVISGEDESSYSFNLKFMPAFVRGQSNAVSQFEFVPFGTQYAHGKTVIPSITSTGFVSINLAVKDADTIIPEIELDGLVALPPQFEGDVDIGSFAITGTLKQDNFTTGDVRLPAPFTTSGKIASGEDFEGDVRLPVVQTEAVSKVDLAVFGEVTIPPVLSDGLIRPADKINGDVIIPDVVSGGFINNPWTIISDTLVPNEFSFGGLIDNPFAILIESDISSIETTSFIANGEEGVVVDATFGPVMTVAEMNTIEPEKLLGDVLIEMFELSGSVAPYSLIEGDTTIDFSDIFESESSIVMSNQFDSVILLSDITVDGYVELITGSEITVKLQNITTEAMAELLRRKRHMNLV